MQTPAPKRKSERPPKTSVKAAEAKESDDIEEALKLKKARSKSPLHVGGGGGGGGGGSRESSPRGGATPGPEGSTPQPFKATKSAFKPPLEADKTPQCELAAQVCGDGKFNKLYKII